MLPPRDFPALLAQWPDIRELIAFARAWRQGEIILANGTRLPVEWRPGSANAIIDLRALTPGGAVPASLPAGESGSVLVADAAEPTGVRWI